MKATAYQIQNIKQALKEGSEQEIARSIDSYKVADLASLMVSLGKNYSLRVLDILLASGRATEVLVEMPESALKDLFSNMSEQRILAVFHAGKAEDIVYFLDFFEEEEARDLLKQISRIQQNQVQQFLKYPEDTAGRAMQLLVFSVPMDFTVGQTIELLRKRAKSEPIYYVYCTNKQQQLVGVVSMRQIAVAEESVRLENLISTSVVSVKTESSLQEVAQTVAHCDFLAIPVVNKNNEMLGLITKDEVIDIIQEQATSDLYARAGLEEGDRVFTPAWVSIKYRIPWMFLNLLMAVFASSVVSVFEQTMSRLIILASLKNIVTGIGGNTAIQTLTVITRGIAIGDFRFVSIRKALVKEVIVGAVLGIVTGIGAGVITYFWKKSFMVSLVIFIAMFLNALVAVLAGVCIPLLLNRLNRDPAVGSGVLITTLTDIFGFFAFLGIASLGLKLIGENF